MSWIKNTIKDSVINSMLNGILAKNPDLYVFIDLLNEIPLLQAWLHYKESRKKLNLPATKPIDWLSYIDMAVRLPITLVIVKFLAVEYGITSVSAYDIKELLDDITKIGSNGK